MTPYFFVRSALACVSLLSPFPAFGSSLNAMRDPRFDALVSDRVDQLESQTGAVTQNVNLLSGLVRNFSSRVRSSEEYYLAFRTNATRDASNNVTNATKRLWPAWPLIGEVTHLVTHLIGFTDGSEVMRYAESDERLHILKRSLKSLAHVMITNTTNTKSYLAIVKRRMNSTISEY